MVDLSNLYGGYLKASRYSKVKGSDLGRVYKRYGIKLASVGRKDASDAAIRKRASRVVVKRYLRLKNK